MATVPVSVLDVTRSKEKVRHTSSVTLPPLEVSHPSVTLRRLIEQRHHLVRAYTTPKGLLSPASPALCCGQRDGRGSRAPRVIPLVERS